MHSITPVLPLFDPIEIFKPINGTSDNPTIAYPIQLCHSDAIPRRLCSFKVKIDNFLPLALNLVIRRRLFGMGRVQKLKTRSGFSPMLFKPFWHLSNLSLNIGISSPQE